MMNLGYACINLTLAEEGITTNRGMIKKTFGEKGITYASQLALSNVQALLKILEWNVAHNIRVFRVTSELFPWASEYRLKDMPHYAEIRGVLEACGKMPVRISSHPGPFNKLAGSGATLENTIKDLEIHSEVFDLMNLPASHMAKINIHVGGAYGDKEETLKRFAKNFERLSKNLRSRLTIENDDKPGLFTVKELTTLHETTGIPIVFDYFHHKLHPGTQTEEEAFDAAYKTWDVVPTFHYSSSRKENENPEAKKEAHSDWVHDNINTYGKEVDIMLETKMKELSLLKYRNDHGL
jgi:UV DNA damage endonuclease